MRVQMTPLTSPSEKATVIKATGDAPEFHRTSLCSWGGGCLAVEYGGSIVTLFGKCSLTASPSPPGAGGAGGSQHCAAIVNSLGFWVKVGLVLRKLMMLSGPRLI